MGLKQDLMETKARFAAKGRSHKEALWAISDTAPTFARSQAVLHAVKAHLPPAFDSLLDYESNDDVSADDIEALFNRAITAAES